MWFQIALAGYCPMLGSMCGRLQALPNNACTPSLEVLHAHKHPYRTVIAQHSTWKLVDSPCATYAGEGLAAGH